MKLNSCSSMDPWQSEDRMIRAFFKRLHKGLVQEGIGMTWWSWLFFNFHRAESRAEYYSIVKLGSSISFISISGILGKGKNSNFFCLGFKTLKTLSRKAYILSLVFLVIKISSHPLQANHQLGVWVCRKSHITFSRRTLPLELSKL